MSDTLAQFYASFGDDYLRQYIAEFGDKATDASDELIITTMQLVLASHATETQQDDDTMETK